MSSRCNLLGEAIDLMVRKKCLVMEILQLTEAQAKLLNPERTGELLQLVEQRQGCIEGITIIDKDLQRVEDGLLKSSGLSSLCEGDTALNEGWRQVLDLCKGIQVLWGKVNNKDQLNRQVIGQELAALKRTLQSLRARRGTIQAYRGTAQQRGGYFIDHKK